MMAEVNLEDRSPQPISFYSVSISTGFFDIFYKLRSVSMTHLHIIYCPAIKDH